MALPKAFEKPRTYLLLLLVAIAVSFAQHAIHLSTDIQGRHCIRQSQTMWNVRNFVRHDANILNPRDHMFNGWEENTHRLEFPLMQWSIAMVQKVTGEHIEVARSSVVSYRSSIRIGDVFPGATDHK